MKLSEVIKAIEDGSNSKFEQGYHMAQEFCGNAYFTYKGSETNQVPLDGWKEVKPPRQWSEKELMLFKLLPEWANWIVKDTYGYYCCENEPSKFGESFGGGGKVNNVGCFDFLTITFEESPVYIGDLKGE